jgi:hypothetical protein
MSKWQPFGFIFHRGNRKVEWVGDDSHVGFGEKFPGEKGSVRRCVIVMQDSTPLSSKFEEKSSQVFMQPP